MSHINQRLFVRCEPARAESHLSEFLERQTNGSSVSMLVLRVRLALPRLGTEIELKRDVVATLRRTEAPPLALAARLVDWEPAGGGAFPRFEGKLTAGYDETYASVGLTLIGTYELPAPTAAAHADMLLADRIAAATARTLLREIGAGLELFARREEAANDVETDRAMRRERRVATESAR